MNKLWASLRMVLLLPVIAVGVSPTSGQAVRLDSSVQGETGQRKNGSEDWALQRQEKSKFVGVGWEVESCPGHPLRSSPRREVTRRLPILGGVAA